MFLNRKFDDFEDFLSHLDPVYNYRAKINQKLRRGCFFFDLSSKATKLDYTQTALPDLTTFLFYMTVDPKDQRKYEKINYQAQTSKKLKIFGEGLG